MEQLLTLSHEAYEIAEVYQLGKPVSEYPLPSEMEKINKGMAIVRLAFLFAWLLGMVICVGFAALFYLLSQPTPYTSNFYNALFHILVPGLFLFAGATQTILMFRAIHLMVKKLVVCTGGILTRRGSRQEATTWEQIRAIQLNVASTRTRSSSREPTLTYRIKRTNGSPITLDATRGALVEAQFVQACIPLFLAQYESGVPFTLGKLTLDFTGITRNAHTLPWHEFEMGRVVQNPPRFSIFQRGKDKAWTTLRPQDIPSLALVEKVIEQIRAKQDGIQWAGQNPDLPKLHEV